MPALVQVKEEQTVCQDAGFVGAELEQNNTYLVYVGESLIY
jgi:hypothetical protein